MKNGKTFTVDEAPDDGYYGYEKSDAAGKEGIGFLDQIVKKDVGNYCAENG